MKKYLCSVCETEFSSEGAVYRCLKCGSLDISSEEAIIQPAASGEATAIKEGALHEQITHILRKLCAETYDQTFKSSAWESAITRAAEEVESLMMSSAGK